MPRWTYYIPEDGGDRENAREIMAPRAQDHWDAEDAARYAAEDDWDRHEGYERGTGNALALVVISPDGKEYRFTSTAEVSITHSITEAEEG